MEPRAAPVEVRHDPDLQLDAAVPLLVVGAGACGVVAALVARSRGLDVLVLERDAIPRGSTSMSSGFVPAPGTRVQRARGIDDDPGKFVADLQAKAGGRADPALARAYAEAIGPALDWLGDAHGVPFELLDRFLYPGQSQARMHAVPERTGEALLARLWRAAEAAGVELMTRARVRTLFVDRPPDADGELSRDMADGAAATGTDDQADDGVEVAAERGPPRVLGVLVERPDGSQERIGCDALLLACNGYGGDPALVQRWLPQFAAATYHGHAGNTGDALYWGEALGAAVADLGAAQGHGSLAHPHGILVTWALMMEGGVQVNTQGERFWNEHEGYSEAALAVLGQPGGIAWNLFDERLHRLGLDFPDYRAAVEAGAVIEAADAASLAARIGVPLQALQRTLDDIAACAAGGATDAWGRRFAASQSLQPPYRAVRVTGALFHTQGGLAVDASNRVLDGQGHGFPNLYAAGGAARGVSGDSVAGYLSGNGLLSAIAGGWLAGHGAATASRLSAAVLHAQQHESPWSRDPADASWGIHLADPAPWNVLRGPVFARGPASGLIVQHGRLLASWGTPARADLTFSVAKTYLALLAGVAHDRGLLPDPDVPVGRMLPGIGFDGEHNGQVTWLQLLQQTSEWEGRCFGIPDQVDRYRIVGYQPPVAQPGRKGDARPLSAPGSYWEYNDVRINQLSLALLHLFRRPLPEVFDEAIMQPIGASRRWSWRGYHDAWVDIDGLRLPSVPGGTHWGGGVSIDSFDQLRIMQLLLDGGRAQGRQVLSADWVARMLTPCALAPFYGCLTWLNTGRRIYPSASERSFFAIGAGSTINWVDPDRGLVAIVRWIDAAHFDGFCARVVEALER